MSQPIIYNAFFVKKREKNKQKKEKKKNVYNKVYEWHR